MTFSNKISKVYKKEGIEILNKTSMNENKLLSRAVRKALNNLNS